MGRLLQQPAPVLKPLETSPRPKPKLTTTAQQRHLRTCRWQNPASTKPGAVQQRPPALELISNARRLIEGQVAGVIIGAGPIVWPQLKAKAAEVVAEVGEFPPIPEACGACGMRRTSWRSTGSTVRRGER
jgi:hypothetical protein